MAVRTTLFGNKFAADALRMPARNQLGILKSQMLHQNLKQGERTLKFNDGTIFQCTSVFGFDQIKIYVPQFKVLAKKLVYILKSKLHVFYFIYDSSLYWLVCYADGTYKIISSTVSTVAMLAEHSDILTIQDSMFGIDASSHTLHINTVTGSPSSNIGRVVITGNTEIIRHGSIMPTVGMSNLSVAKDWLIKLDPHTSKHTIYWWKFDTRLMLISASGSSSYYWKTTLSVVFVSPTWVYDAETESWLVSFLDSEFHSTVDWVHRESWEGNNSSGNYPYYIQLPTVHKRFPVMQNYTNTPFHYIEGLETIDSHGANVYKRPHLKWYWNFITEQGGQSWDGYSIDNYLAGDERATTIDLIKTDGLGNQNFSPISAEYTIVDVDSRVVVVPPYPCGDPGTQCRTEEITVQHEYESVFTAILLPGMPAFHSNMLSTHNIYYLHKYSYQVQMGSDPVWYEVDSETIFPYPYPNGSYCSIWKEYFADEVVVYTYQDSRGIFSFNGIWNILQQEYLECRGGGHPPYEDIVLDHQHYTGPFCTNDILPTNVQVDNCGGQVQKYAAAFHEERCVMLGDATNANRVTITESIVPDTACTLDNRGSPVDANNVGILQVFKAEVAEAESWHIYYNFVDITGTVDSLMEAMELDINDITGFGML